jgi:Integrase zinc binding domain
MIKDSVLYRKTFDKHFNVDKFTLCVPDELMPSVIHALHTDLGHPSLTATVKNFMGYYFHRRAARLIKDYVRSCVTCIYAGKYDVKKIVPSTERTLQPKKPRQHLYCDLIPMPKSQFGYILFCLDAYSQYIYAMPLKDKTAPAVLQGFLSLFATTGWYESLYLDNESSFQKAAKLLVKIAPGPRMQRSRVQIPAPPTKAGTIGKVL